MTDLLDISATRTGSKLPQEQSEVVGRLTGHDPLNHVFVRGFHRENDKDVNYVLVQHLTTKAWKTYRLDAINDLLKEEANVS